jgi:hypothetical protein
MSNRTITSSNSVTSLWVPGLLPAVTLQDFSVDKMFSTDALEIAETQMGVDGTFTAGYIATAVKMTFTLRADSDDRLFFNSIYAAEKTYRDKYFIYGTIILPSLGELYTLNKGVLTSIKQIPDAAKVLQAIDYTITWASVDYSPI